MRTVELLPAVQWACEDCGRDNFERCPRIDPESLEGTALLEDANIEASELAELIGLPVGGSFLVQPKHVRCQHCGAEFDVASEDDDGTEPEAE